MSFTTAFSLQALLSAALSYVWLCLPGWLTLRCLPKLVPAHLRPLLAPIVGFCVFGPLSVVCFAVLPFTRGALLAVGLVVNGVLWRAGTRVSAEPAAATGRSRDAWLLHVAACAFGIAACVPSYPFVYDGGLYTTPAIHDQARVVFIDAIYRHGLPPLNPLFAPGHDVYFNYYYLFIFVAAQLRMLGGASGWPALIALTWFSFAAVLGTGAALASALGRTRVAAWVSLALLLCGAWSPLPVMLGARRTIPTEFAGTLAEQIGWCPHHVVAAAAIALSLFVLTRAVASGEYGRGCALLLAGLLASVIECSMWLALAFALCGPFLVAAAWRTSGPGFPHGKKLGWLGLRAALVAFAVSLPVLAAATGGAYAFSGSPVVVQLRPVFAGVRSSSLQFVAYWLWMLPTAFGPVFVLGLLGCLRPGERAAHERMFAALCAACGLGCLVVAQLLRSAVINNDLGWRAPLVTYVLFSVWAAQVVERLARHAGPSAGVAMLARVAARGAVLLALAYGLYQAPFRPPRPAAHESARVRDQRRRLLVQAHAWRVVRRYAGPEDFVLANPAAFTDLTPWPINLGYSLFADRRTVMVHPNQVLAYSHGMDPELLRGITVLATMPFGNAPNRELLRGLRDDLHVKALLVDRDDPVWPTQNLEHSGIYDCVYSEHDFRVYVAASLAAPAGGS